MRIDVFGIDIEYIDEGQGEIVLLLHGWAAPIEVYRRVIDELSPRYRVIAPQMPGSGNSAEPKTAMSIEDYAAFVAEFCAKLGVKKAILMGHSNGGRIIFQMLSGDCPIECPKVVLIDSAGILPKRSAKYYIKVYSYKLAKRLGTARLTKPIFGKAFEKMRNSRGSDDYKNASDVMKKTLVNLVNLDMTEQMRKVSQNTLLIFGENDTATPLSDGQMMEKIMPSAGLAVIKNAGHFAFLDNTPQFMAVLKVFLP